ncbi:MAG: 4'-phosphopantetheinyl transferase superfamily protein [Clostridia bacterium]|nr:4'-phosphopantetheinyl transferase superfamily protein [Clostridia bacterium]
MIYLFEGTDNIEINFVDTAAAALNRQRTEKIRQYRSPNDKINGTIVYLLLRYALKKEFGITEPPELVYRKRGKPYLKHHNDIYFNFSHCKNAAACVVSHAETAIDIIDIRTVQKSTARHVCSPEELQMLDQCDDYDRSFLRLWTQKECYAKWDGQGLALDFSRLTDSLPVIKSMIHHETEQYIMTCYSCEPASIVFFHHPYELLDSIQQ